MDDVKCLTVQQPYASAFFAGGFLKDYENRTWYTKHRGLLLIHAGKSFYPDRFQHVESINPAMAQMTRVHYPRGAFVGAVRLTDCVRYEDMRMWNPWACGPYCWHMVKPVLFMNTVPWRGAQGLWSITRSELQDVLHQAETLLKADTWSCETVQMLFQASGLNVCDVGVTDREAEAEAQAT